MDLYFGRCDQPHSHPCIGLCCCACCMLASQHLLLCVQRQSSLQRSRYRLLAVTASSRVVRRRLAVSILVLVCHHTVCLRGAYYLNSVLQTERLVRQRHDDPHARRRPVLVSCMSSTGKPWSMRQRPGASDADVTGTLWTGMMQHFNCRLSPSCRFSASGVCRIAGRLHPWRPCRFVELMAER